VLLVVALIAPVFGFVGTAAVALALAKGMFLVFPVLFFGSILGGLLRRA